MLPLLPASLPGFGAAIEPRQSTWTAAPGSHWSSTRWTQSVGCVGAVAMSLVRCSSSTRRSHCRRNRRGRHIIRTQRSAVVEGHNQHAVAVQKWLDDVVIGLGFCPWASPAEEAGGIRIATSSSTTSAEVFDDLVQEAKGLWVDRLKSKTTLLVCPNVKAWNRDFRYFHAFYSWYLDGGFALAESGIKVVPFHPKFALLPQGPESGDFVMVPGPDGQDAGATVIEKNVGKDEAGEYCMAVRFANGEEGLIRHASVMAQSSDKSSDADLCRDFTSRAPRPVLHLLRLPDLLKAEQEAQRMPKKQSPLQKKTKEMEAELEREARDEARDAFQRGRMELREEAKDTRVEQGRRARKDVAKIPFEGDELEEMRGMTQTITDRNEFMVKSLGPLRLTEIMENCEASD